MAISWNENLSVKIELFDLQHRKLIELINGFYENVHKGAGKENFLLFTKSLKEYSVYHFSAEEKLMKEYDFPGFDSHKIEHNVFIEQVVFFEEKFKSGKDVVILEVINYVKDWVINHVMGTDKKYSDFLVLKGVR